eukprot:321233-Amphidinium_carterae.1
MCTVTKYDHSLAPQNPRAQRNAIICSLHPVQVEKLGSARCALLVASLPRWGRSVSVCVAPHYKQLLSRFQQLNGQICSMWTSSLELTSKMCERRREVSWDENS